MLEDICWFAGRVTCLYHLLFHIDCSSSLVMDMVKDCPSMWRNTVTFANNACLSSLLYMLTQDKDAQNKCVRIV